MLLGLLVVKAWLPLREPLDEVRFRPEDGIVASATTSEDDGACRLDRGQALVPDSYVDAVQAVNTRVVDAHFSLEVLTAHEQ